MTDQTAARRTDVDPRIDPRYIPFLEMMDQINSNLTDVDSRDALLAAANHPKALEQEERMIALYNASDNETVAPKTGLRITRETITSEPDGNCINLCIIRPDTDETLPCLYYIHGGGMMVMSCFYGNYQTWGRLLAHEGIAVVMVDFRNSLRPSSVEEVAPYPAGLNDCVSGFHWVHSNADALGIDPNSIVIGGESGGGNLAIATTMALKQAGHGDQQAGLYALCPYIAGRWPQESLPSSIENDGIFIRVGNNRGAMAYGIEALEAQDPIAWPGFATPEDLKGFPPTTVRVNECDPLRDEGIQFYRKLLAAGVSAQCVQSMGTVHAGELIASITPDISLRGARDIGGWVKQCRRHTAR